MQSSNIESLISQIQAQSTDESTLNLLNITLKAHQTEAILRRESPSTILDALQQLDVATHSLGYLYMLEAKLRQTNGKIGSDWMLLARKFLLKCNDNQIRLAPKKFSGLCRTLKTQALADNQLPSLVFPLRAALLKLCPPGSKLLSSIHVDFFQACLLARWYSVAVPILDEDSYNVDQGRTACKATDILLYSYYGSMIELGRKRYDRALDLLNLAITAPTSVVNAITIACLKRWVLVSVIHHPERGVPSLPRHAPLPITKVARSECGHYFELAKLMCSVSPQQHENEGRGNNNNNNNNDTTTAANSAIDFATRHGSEWSGDGNAGLVRLAIQGNASHRVQQLTYTYLRLGVDDPQLPSEMDLLKMIDGQRVDARISNRNKVVTFGGEMGGGEEGGEDSGKLECLITRVFNLQKEVSEFSNM
jgi:COP9 signalosome complex subunit 3